MYHSTLGSKVIKKKKKYLRWGAGCGGWGVGIAVWGLGFGVQGLGLKV